mgnify:CR=1 FL=1
MVIYQYTKSKARPEKNGSVLEWSPPLIVNQEWNQPITILAILYFFVEFHSIYSKVKATTTLDSSLSSWLLSQCDYTRSPG